MIRFDASKLHCSYVTISKITSNYVYVVADQHGHVFRHNDTTDGVHFDRKVKKLRISSHVAADFFTTYKMREFKHPRYCSLNFYGDDLVSIELQKYNTELNQFENRDTWTSVFSSLIPRIESRLEGEEVYLLGTKVAWLDAVADRGIKLGEHGFFATPAKFISLSSVGIKDAFDKDNDDAHHIFVRMSPVILYFFDEIPLDGVPVKNYRFAMSPVLSRGSVAQDKGRGGSLNVEDFNKYDASCMNLNFIVKATGVIGTLFGYKAIDFLNIPRIITSLETVSIKNIHRSVRARTSCGIKFYTAFSWVMGYFYRETDFRRSNALASLIVYIAKKGVASKSLTNEEIDAINSSKEESQLLPIPSFKEIEIT